ncbi:ferritin-like domain-containing protein [Arthrobacter sp. zg-Y859]|uniref:Ferritin-like domain-containing protein n=1 Tax=Arthrobacter jinronghuae TaxID=2964609 RepID=A0ABT1NUJ2_9MICC|nr:DUF4439 domain-containing protein [Arthrobacter jinronghuae]MCQ1951400.1 ferritin-like domain-containing protein [Arthrobacter jinronghuae]UWX79746.1 ferritin-like domain-containing protein [Arthrobacter jinronghuae]
MTSSTVVDAPLENPGPEPEPARRFRRLGAGARRLVLFLALGAVVLSFGLVAGTGDAPERARSFSEIALTEARNSARSLSAEAGVLAAAGKNPGAAELLAQAEGLRDQAALLTGTGREPAAARNGFEEPLDVSGTAGKDGARSAGAPEVPDAKDLEPYVQALAASAQANLQSAWRADAGTARLLAATGAAQQVWAARTAGLYGLDLPETDSAHPGDPAAESEATGVPATDKGLSNCPDAGTGEVTADSAAGTPSGSAAAGSAAPSAAAALKAAVDAEFGAAYAYEVALAQDPSAATRSEQWQTRMAAHESRGTDAVAYLPDLCLPAVAPVAAYRLDPGFLRNPADALPALEQQFPAVYADLVALSEGDLRGWAIGRLAAVSEELYLQAEMVPAAPGLDAVPEDLPWN